MHSLELSASPGHLIRRLHQLSTSLWTAMVSENVTSPQFAILNFLADNPRVDQTTLGAGVSLDRASTTEIVGRMTKRGLIQRIKDPSDQRRWQLTLTDLGCQKFEELAPLSILQNNYMTKNLSDKERAAVLGYLQQILDIDPDKRKTSQIRDQL